MDLEFVLKWVKLSSQTPTQHFQQINVKMQIVSGPGNQTHDLLDMSLLP